MTRTNRTEYAREGLPHIPPVEGLYTKYRKYAFAIAYRMLGSAEGAEDAVQDCFAELHRRRPQDVTHIKAYIARMITNACLNTLNSARSRRETYIGEWLPEPVSGIEDDPEVVAERRDMLSYAYLVLLDRLSPGERTVFVLREAFRYDYAAIAEMTGRTEAGCRQIYSRVKRMLQAEPAVMTADSGALRTAGQRGEVRASLLRRFTAAFAAYDVGGMMELLAEQPVFIADGGGRKVRTVVRPMIGRKGVLALLTSRRIYAQLREWEASPELVNGELQLVFRQNGRVMAVLCLLIAEAAAEEPQIRELYLVLADDKLGGMN
ncbi:sigma-70 family RNA polymerase sigma factor [Saccharibacillus kuerlensis]|uniref:RNA polymerase sigma factor SigJ n=1 Tax=Saccharibacillus kuerlensis TaxID=459527 RepID=A0ABQ2L6F5_9BACL|nr:sigma-70 family RNA polymerase sigma factor [Saccharibacillus kuerlensis]GGO04880.1 RNA polymerase sigma factor SigJ [Saccharibacillus kuerlensis]